LAKTLKQIADEIGVSKQRVYRFVKQFKIPASYQDGNKMYYDEAVETSIKEEFLSKDSINETLHKNSDLEKLLQDVSKTYQETLQSASERIETLQNVYQKELESRDKRIEQLQTEISQLRADIGQLRADLSAAWQRNDEISGKLIQLTDQAQKLQLMQMQPPAFPVPEEEMPDKKQGFWKRIFGKKE